MTIDSHTTDGHATGAVPPGLWTLDEHTTAPPGTLHTSVFVDAMSDGFTRAFASYGIPGTRVAGTVVDGWLYMGFQPLTDPDELARRVQLTTTTDMVALMQEKATAYLDRGGVLDEERRRLVGSITGLDAAVLADRIEMVAARTREVVADRFADIVVGSLIAEYVWAAAERLGWSEETALARLGGNPVNATVFHSLESAASSLLATRPDLIERVRAGEATLDEVAGALEGTEAGAALDRDLEILFEGSVSSPMLRERPDVVLDALARLLEPDREAGDGVAPTGTDEPMPEELSDVVTSARLALRWRDESHNTIVRWLGLMRATATEAGRRLEESGGLSSSEHAFDLDDEELANALRAAGSGPVTDDWTNRFRSIAAERNARRVQQAGRIPPPVIGTLPGGPPGPPPGVVLPPAFERNAARVMWLMSHIGTPPPASPASDDVQIGPGVGADGVRITGVGASPGVAEGPARVLRGVDDFDRFEAGDVLVCSVTSPAWDALLATASAVVTDTGGIAGHSAITAREIGLPAVVGTGTATSTFVDGQRLRVDGSTGTVDSVAR